MKCWPVCSTRCESGRGGEREREEREEEWSGREESRRRTRGKAEQKRATWAWSLGTRPSRNGVLNQVRPATRAASCRFATARATLSKTAFAHSPAHFFPPLLFKAVCVVHLYVCSAKCATHRPVVLTLLLSFLLLGISVVSPCSATLLSEQPAPSLRSKRPGLCS